MVHETSESSLPSIPSLNLIRSVVLSRSIRGSTMTLLVWGGINLIAWLVLGRGFREFLQDLPYWNVGIYIVAYGGGFIGWLLISDPTHQSTEQITKALMASKGSISTMTRLLIQIGLIERLSLPGVRHDYFRLRSDAWQHMIGRGLTEEIRMVRQLAERGLELLGDKTPVTRGWLEEMCDVYTFLEKEFPTLLERWEKEHQKVTKR